MFKKKIKLYAINPLLVALVALGLNSANLPSEKLEINENDKSLTLSVSESQEDSSKASTEEKSDEDYSYLKDLNLSLKLDDSHKTFLDDELKNELEFKISLEDETIILEEEKEATEPSEEATSTEASESSETSETNEGTSTNKENLVIGEASLSKDENTLNLKISIDVKTSKILDLLNKREFNYFELVEEEDKIKLVLVPDEGLVLDDLKDEQIFLKLEKNKASVISGAELKATAESETSSQPLSNVEYVAEVNDSSDNKANKQKEQNPAPTSPVAEAPTSTNPAPTPTTTVAPTPTTTAAPAPTTTAAPTEAATTASPYLDMNTAAQQVMGVTHGVNGYVFATKEEAVAFGNSKREEAFEETDRYNEAARNGEDVSNWQWTNFMDVNGYTGWGAGDFIYTSNGVRQTAWVLQFY